MKVSFQNVTEALSVPAFHMAYRELDEKHKLWGKSIDELSDFFDSLNSKSLRRVLKALGVYITVTGENRLEIYVGGESGLLVVDTPVPPEAMEPKGTAYECSCCGRAVDKDYLEDAALTAIICLYNDEKATKKAVAEYCIVQPIDVTFPYSGKRQWHEADVLRILAEGVLANKLGLPDIVSPQKLEGVTRILTERVGIDFGKWAETRARNIREGIEPMPDFFGYKRVKD